MIGKTINDLRKKYGLTQNELAERLQVSNKTVSKWESKLGEPSIEFLLPIAELFGVSVEYLLSGQNSSDKNSLCFKHFGLVTRDEFLSFTINQVGRLSNDELGMIPMSWLVAWSNKNEKDLIYEIYRERLNGYFSSKYEEGLDKLFREKNNNFLSLAVENAFGWRDYGRFANFRDRLIKLNYLAEEYHGDTPYYRFIEMDKSKILEVLKEI